MCVASSVAHFKQTPAGADITHIRDPLQEEISTGAAATSPARVTLEVLAERVRLAVRHHLGSWDR
eukprot:7891893-Pyramimonas_sp.AAC.1